MSTGSHPWGRVADDGTVYVRTADGERVVGIWQAGSPDEALEFFTRRYDSLATEVSLLERRITTTDLAPGQAKTTIARLRATDRRGQVRRRPRRLSSAVSTRCPSRPITAARSTRRPGTGPGSRRSSSRSASSPRPSRSRPRRRHWKSGGERLKQLLDEWKAAPHGDRHGRGRAVEAHVGGQDRVRQAAQGLLRRARGRARGSQGAQAAARRPGPRNWRPPRTGPRPRPPTAT